MPSQSTLCLTFDFDAMSVWFGYKNVTPAMLYRGEYGARVGVLRLLTLLRRYGIRTFFVPGHHRLLPCRSEAILSAARDCPSPFYAHIDPQPAERRGRAPGFRTSPSRSEKIGVRPLGFRSPSKDFSASTLSLLEEYGLLYDSSLMADDFAPTIYIGEQTQQTPLVKGPGRHVSGELPMRFRCLTTESLSVQLQPHRNGTSAPSKVLEIWQADFDWMHEHVENGILTVTMHPQGSVAATARLCVRTIHRTLPERW
ncbi:MAG: hypothetical protein U0175_26825 [Caldilineaceae bacterium]